MTSMVDDSRQPSLFILYSFRKQMTSFFQKMHQQMFGFAETMNMKTKMLFLLMVTSLSIQSQGFEGIVTFKITENQHHLLTSLVNLQNRPGPIERYLNRDATVHIVEDTMIYEIFDSFGVLIHTQLQIDNRIYSHSGFSSLVFKDMTHYPPAISMVEDWQQIDDSKNEYDDSSLHYFIAPGNSHSDQTIEIGVDQSRNIQLTQNRTGLFKYFFHHGRIYYERLKYGAMLRVKSDFQYEDKEVSSICLDKITGYHIE